MGKRYTKIHTGEDGWSEWIQPVEHGYKMACCDCGLVHVLEFRVHANGRAQFRARRDNRKTAAVRRHMRPKPSD